MDFNKVLAILIEERKETFVKIKGNKNAKGEDLFKIYPWFKDWFKEGNVTGVVRGSAGGSIFDQDKVQVQFAIIEKGKLIKKAGQANSFTPDQLEEI